MATIILTTFNNPIEANLTKDLLRENDINCFLANEINSQILPHLNGIMGAGIQLLIDESDLERASELVHQNKSQDEIACPNCHSTNIQIGLGEHKFKKILTVFFSLIFWVPFGNINTVYFCRDCKTEF